MTGRPEDGYRVASRIEGRSSWRGRFLAVVLGMTVIGWAGVTLADRLGGGGPHRSAAPASGETGRATGRATGPPSLAPGQTFPSAVEIRRPDAAGGDVPVDLDGLAWLNVQYMFLDGRLSQDQMQWPFALADGSACVCLGHGLDGRTAVLYLYRYDLAGHVVSNRSEPWPEADLASGLVDAILDPSGNAAIVGSISQATHGWNLTLARIPFDSSQAVQSSVSPIEIAELGDSAQVVMRLTSAPDGSVLRVDLTRLADDPRTEWHGAWLVPVADGRFGPAVPTPAAPSDVPFTQCRGQAWATPTIFVELCYTPRDDGRFDVFANLQDREGVTRAIALGPVQLDDPLGWLVDGTHGVVYAWTSFTHGIFRIDAATRELSLRLLAGVDGNGAPMIPTVTPEPALPPQPGASPDGSQAAWQPTIGASQSIESPLVGSPDGRLLYAAGLSIGQNGGAASTGIWVFDSASLALVDHWPAVVSYRAIGLDPSGTYLIGTGEPSAEEIAAFGNHGEELAVLDRGDGSVIAILRDLDLRLGGVPVLLPPPLPAPPSPALP
jgi:hypothetical protein